MTAMQDIRQNLGGGHSLGVGYTVEFSKKVIRLSTSIFFSFTFDILITNQEKVVKNIIFKKCPDSFPV